MGVKKRLIVWYFIVVTGLVLFFYYGISNNVWGHEDSYEEQDDYIAEETAIGRFA